MFQDVYGDLPVMSTEVLALRRQLWDTDGIHLIYNTGLLGEGVTRTGPTKPYAGLCVVFLLLMRNDNMYFAPQVGDRPRAYQVGWGQEVDGYGLFSIAYISDNNWVGYKDPTHAGFPAGYYYVYFYFETFNTLHGFINNMDLQSSDTNPYNVDEASSTILFGQTGWHKAETLEIHWVVWDRPFNATTSQSLKDHMYSSLMDEYGQLEYAFANIFNVRSGAVITLTAMYEPSTSSKVQIQPDTGISIALMQEGDLTYDFHTYETCKDPSAVYVFRINVTASGGIVYHEGIAGLMWPPLSASTMERPLGLLLINAKPLRAYIEHMGYSFI